MQIKTAGLVIDDKNPKSRLIAKDIINYLISNDIRVSVYPPIEYLDEDVDTVDSISNLSGDMVFSIGGDGTILRTFLFIKDKDTPVMGIGLGEKNFLSAVTWENYKLGIQQLIDGKVYIKQEMRLEVEVPNYNVDLPPVLNEVLFATSILGKTIDAYLALMDSGDKVKIWGGKSDGIIISTPIGSTAYSRSAGGPVIDTDLECTIITPLLPVDRKPVLVVKPDREIILWASKKRNKPIIVLDGQIKIELDWEDEVIIRKSRYYANFVTLDRNMSVSRIIKASR